MPFYNFSKTTRVLLSDDEHQLLIKLKKFTNQATLNEDQIILAERLVNKMILYKKKKNDTLNYVKCR